MSKKLIIKTPITNENEDYLLNLPNKDRGEYTIATTSDVAAEHNLIKTTWAELKSLRDNSKLIPGRFYRITDYVTTTSQENTRSAGHQFDIIVRADDEKTLNENATAAIHEGDEYFQEVIGNARIINWKEGVTLNSITEKYMISENNDIYLQPSISYKEFTEMLIITNKEGVNVPCLFNSDPTGKGADDYLVYCGTYNWKTTTNTLLTDYYIMSDNDESTLYWGSYNKKDIFVEIAYKDINGISTPVLYKEDLNIYLNDTSSVDYEDEFRYLDDYIVDGVKYNRWVKYGYGTDGNYQILTNIIVVNNQFTVSPEEFKTAVRETSVIYDKWQECDSTGEPKQGSYYILTNNLVDPEIKELGPSFKCVANLSAWEIKYCLDNDADRFTWADEENGKGVIYYMKDEWNNECPYDFKNILFTKWNKYENAYTFSYTEDSVIKDASILGKEKKCYNNIIKEYINSNQKQQLNFNVFYSISTDFSCYLNAFGNNCYDNKFGNNCYNNRFGNYCSTSIFANNCCSNVFGHYCYNNILGNYCMDNKFGNNCCNNKFGNYCRYTTFGNNCCNNKFGNYCRYNTFGNNCNYNIFGNNCYNNTLGNDCVYTILGTRSGSTNTLGDYYQYNIIDNGCSYLCLNSNGTASLTNQLQNIHINSGIKGTESAYKNITVERNLSYSITILAPGSREIILDDLDGLDEE